MYKLRYALPVALVLGVTAPIAESQVESGANPVITTAQGAATFQGSRRVQLHGQIVERRGPSNYVLSDASGKVEVEITDALLRGQNLAPGTEVEIRGDVDGTNGRPTKVAANYVNVVTP